MLWLGGGLTTELGESCVAGIEMVRTEQEKQKSDYTWASECFLYLLKD